MSIHNNSQSLSLIFDLKTGLNTRNTTEWLGPFDSGETQTSTHSWSEKGTYTVKPRLVIPMMVVKATGKH